MDKKYSLVTGHWAIEENYFNEIKAAAELRAEDPKAFMELMPAEKQENKLINIDGDIATIKISGPLMNRDTWVTRWFGGTAYPTIIEAISIAEENDSVKSINFDIDSPGGAVAGVDNTALAIKNIKKPTKARVGNMAASAAYWLATQADKIDATSLTARFGSIGVIVAYYDYSEMDKKYGIKHVVITSSGAPDKYADGATKEGAEKIRAELDDIENVFVKRVAEGRGTTNEKVLEDFGQGGVLIAEKALNAGMIDKIATNDKFSVESESQEDDADATQDVAVNKSQNPADAGIINMEGNMDLKEFMASNPASAQEVEQLKVEQFKAGAKANSEEMQKRVNAACDVLDEASEYPQAIKTFAIGTLKGEKSVDALEGAKVAYDAMNEGKKSDAAKADTTELPETPAENASVDMSEAEIENRVLANIKGETIDG